MEIKRKKIRKFISFLSVIFFYCLNISASDSYFSLGTYLKEGASILNTITNNLIYPIEEKIGYNFFHKDIVDSYLFQNLPQNQQEPVAKSWYETAISYKKVYFDKIFYGEKINLPQLIDSINFNKYPRVATFTLFLWPEKKDIPLIRLAALTKIKKLTELDALSQTEDGKYLVNELQIISQFYLLKDVQTFVLRHMKTLKDLYNDPVMDEYYYEKEKNQKMQQIIMSKNSSVPEEKISIMFNKVLESYACWVKQSDSHPFCEKTEPPESEKKSFNLITPTSCEQMKQLPWKSNLFKIRSCFEKTKKESLILSLLDPSDKEQLSKLKNEMSNLQNMRSERMESKIIQEIKLIHYALEPNIESSRPRLNFFDTPFDTGNSFNFQPSFKDPDISKIKITIRNNLVFSASHEEDDSLIFNSSEKTVKEMQAYFQNDLLGYRFQMVNTSNNGNILFEVNLNSYPSPHNLRMEGKVKLTDSKQTVRYGMMGVTFIED